MMMILKVVLFLFLFAVVSANLCSISYFTRRRCKVNSLILHSEACLQAGCCFDSSPLLPITMRCYSSGNSIRWGGFQPTVAPPRLYTQSSSGIQTFGGEPGFPGSEFILKCNRFRTCPSGRTRNSCIRQGCCWSGGRCFQQKYHIFRLRSKCPSGYENPPKCRAINPCDDNPCKNGGVCKFTGANQFSCSCKSGFSGTTCEPNCKRSELVGVVIPDKYDYMEGEHVKLECPSTSTHQLLALQYRQCINSQFSPPLSTHPFICSEDCMVAKPEGTVVISTLASSVHHGVDVTYAPLCKSGTISAHTNVLTRTCTNGKLLPDLSVNKIECVPKCGFLQIPSEVADNQLTASSYRWRNHRFAPYRARLFSTSGWGGWMANTAQANEWIQADLSKDEAVVAVATQGRYTYDQWVTSYYVSYKTDIGTSFVNVGYTVDNPIVFQGNSDRNTVVVHKFPTGTINARYFRIHPLTWHGKFISIRFDVMKC